MYELKVNLLPVGHRLRPGGKYTKKSLTAHSTANASSTPQGERNWLNNATNKRNAAWNYCVGAGIVIQALPDVEECWHSGTTEGNCYSIGIEIVESGDRYSVLMTAAEFFADKLIEYGWGVDKLKRHYDWAGKNCPRILIDPSHIKGNMNWDWFVRKVDEFRIQKLKAKESASKKPEIIITTGKVIVDGKEHEMQMVNVDGYNYVKIRDFAEPLGYAVSSQGKTPVLTKKS